MIKDVNLGDKVLYKKASRRGRPAVAEVVGIITEIRNNNGEIVQVSMDEVSPYVYRPYKRRNVKRMKADNTGHEANEQAPRPRGRPRKEVPEEGERMVMAMPRKRGRPRKIVETQDRVEQTAPRKRGRPRKVRSEPETVN